MTVTRDHYLEVNGVPLATFAWDAPDLSPMFDTFSLLGGDRLIPGGNAVPKPRRTTVSVYTLPLYVFGERDEDGTPYADPQVGLATNMQYLVENLGLAKSTGDGTVTVTWHRDSLNDYEGDAHFLGFRGSSPLGRHSIRTTFDLSFPNGFSEVTP